MASNRASKSLALLAGALALAPLASGPAHARGIADGRMGAESRATIAIRVSVAPRLEVNRTESPQMRPGNGTLTGQAFCVSSTAGMGTYSITAVDVSQWTSDERGAAAGQFPYEVEWAAAGGTSAPLQLAPGAPLAGLSPVSHGACSSAQRLIVRPAKVAYGRSRAAGRALLLLLAPE